MRSFLVVPAIAVACSGVSFAAGQGLVPSLAVGVLGAALAAAVRAFVGASAVAAIAAGAAAALGAFALVGDAATVRAIAGCAAALFAVAELARPLPPAASPLPAIGGALAAAALDPSWVALVVVAGARWQAGPWPRPRGSLGLPIAGALACMLAVAAALARHGALATLWQVWAGGGARAQPIDATAARIGDALGPLAAVAALAGLAVTCARGKWSACAIAAITVGALGVALRAGTLAPSVVAVAALATGIAIARFAALVRWPAGQAIVGATAALLVLAVPAWDLVAR